MKKDLPKIFSLLKISVVIICSLAIFLATARPAVAQGDENRPLAGNWKTDLFFHPGETDGSIDLNSSLPLDFSPGSFDIGNTSTFSNIGDSSKFKNQAFELSGRLEMFGASPQLVFDTKNNRLDCWLSETSLTFGGATFLLEYHLSEYMPGVGFEGYLVKYGTGFEFSVFGEVPGGGSVEINTDCFTTYFNLVEGSLNTYQFEVEGFGFTDVKVGRVNFNSIAALTGDLYKDAGASEVILRADDYLIDPDNTDPYENTEFDEIASISVSPPDTAEHPNYSLGIDFYFDMTDEDTLIDLSPVTGDLTARVSQQFELGMGTSITPDGDVETLLSSMLTFDANSPEKNLFHESNSKTRGVLQ